MLVNDVARYDGEDVEAHCLLPLKRSGRYHSEHVTLRGRLRMVGDGPGVSVDQVTTLCAYIQSIDVTRGEGR